MYYKYPGSEKNISYQALSRKYFLYSFSTFLREASFTLDCVAPAWLLWRGKDSERGNAEGMQKARGENPQTNQAKTTREEKEKAKEDNEKEKEKRKETTKKGKI